MDGWMDGMDGWIRGVWEGGDLSKRGGKLGSGVWDCGYSNFGKEKGGRVGREGRGGNWMFSFGWLVAR